jgi:hypothetical protein
LKKNIALFVKNIVDANDKTAHFGDEEFKPKDEFDLPLYAIEEKFTCSSSIRNFTQELRTFSAKNRLGPEAELDLLKLFHKVLPPTCSLPIKIVPKSQNMTSLVDKVLEETEKNESGVIELDMCINGCCVYVNHLEDNIMCPSTGIFFQRRIFNS